jgi:hypothetical protein
MEYTAREQPGSFSPRGLIVTGIVLHVIFALVFWQFSLGFILTIPIYFPIAGRIALVVVPALAIWFTIFAWRRNSWLISALYLIISICTLPWMFTVLAFWPHPS